MLFDRGLPSGDEDPGAVTYRPAPTAAVVLHGADARFELLEA